MTTLSGPVAILSDDGQSVIAVKDLGPDPVAVKPGRVLPIESVEPTIPAGYERGEPSYSIGGDVVTRAWAVEKTVPSPITMRQLRLGLIQFGGKSADFIQTIIDKMPSPAKDFAQVWYDETSVVNWDHPQTQLFMAESGIPLDQCAQMWMAAAATFEA